jgi:hypothetical protein
VWNHGDSYHYELSARRRGSDLCTEIESVDQQEHNRRTADGDCTAGEDGGHNAVAQKKIRRARV